MQLNADKQDITFSNERFKPRQPPIKLGNEIIPNIPKTPRSYFDSKLNFQSHIFKAITKMRREMLIIPHISS